MNIPKEICVLIADHGIGDHYVVAGFAEAVGRQHGVRVWMAGRENLAFVRDLFPAVEGYLTLPVGTSPSLIPAPKRVTGGAFYYAHFPQLELARAVGYNGFHFLDAYRCRLDLPVSATLSRARLPSADELSRAGEYLRDRNLTPGQTVVISQEARTTCAGAVRDEFWVDLAMELKATGLQPLVNVGSATKVPEGIPAFALPLDQFRALTEAAGFVCAVRNGLADLVSDLRCRKLIVYPDARYNAGPLFAGTTFGRYGLERLPQEVVVSRDYPAGQVGQIARRLIGAPVLQEA